MEGQIVAESEVDKVADKKADMAADQKKMVEMELDMVADMVADKKKWHPIWWIVGYGGWLIGPKLLWPEAYPTCVSSKLCKFILVVSILILYKPSWFLLLNPQLNRCFTYRRPFLKPFLQMKKMGPTLCFLFFWQKNSFILKGWVVCQKVKLL